MSDRVWHSGPPPHVGWWNASISRANGRWRWWDGQVWSKSVTHFADAKTAVVVANRKYSPGQKINIEWSEYYPENARVPRIDPRKA